MAQRKWWSMLGLIMLIVLGTADSSYAAMPNEGLQRLRQASLGPLEVTFGYQSPYPSFLRGETRLPALTSATPEGLTSAAQQFLQAHGRAFGIAPPRITQELTLIRTETDEFGLTHANFQQTYHGVPVYNARISVHLSAKQRSVQAISNGYVPGVQVGATVPRISMDQALAIAQQLPPGGAPTGPAQLVIYAGSGSALDGASAHLAWAIELNDDDSMSRNIYMVDARFGSILDILSRSYDALNRKTYNGDNKAGLPGRLVRSEGDGPTGDADVDKAHDFAGATYNYYMSTHSRDSYDNKGGAIISTVHYSQNYNNAAWNGTQMFYGNGMVALDVVAHELTHAVNQYTAQLEYSWQSGAMNESFSDIFGAMVDRKNWLIGEDLPPNKLGGRDAIRDMANPSRFGQPDHTSKWVSTCSDNQGVHINSGIFNKAYVNIATAISKEKAERIFYRMLTVYLKPNSTMEDARAAALQAASDIFGAGSAEQTGVRDGFNAVGLDGRWQPAANKCDCSASLTLEHEPDGLTALENLRAMRDQVFARDPLGQRWIDLYYKHQFETAWLVLSNPDLRDEAVAGFKSFDPLFSAVVANQQTGAAGPTVTLTPELIGRAQRILLGLADRGSVQLRADILREWNLGAPYRLAGLDAQQAWNQLRRENQLRESQPASAPGSAAAPAPTGLDPTANVPR